MVRSCGLFRALLGDYDGLYDPTDFNDRLLLGLKGIMSEAELHFLRLRMHEGRLNKARRGELFNTRRSAMYANPAAGWPSTPTSKLSRWCGWSSTNSIARAACMDCYATWSITLSACRFGLTTGRIGGSWSGVVPIERHSKICYIIRSMPATTVTATALSTPVGRCPAGPGQGGQLTSRRTAWCCWRTAARPTSRRKASGPTRSGWRPTAPAPRRLERCARGPLCWEESSVAGVAGNG